MLSLRLFVLFIHVTAVIVALGGVVTGIFNVMFLGAISPLLIMKLALVVIAIILAIYQYGTLGMRIWRVSANGPDPALAPLQARFRSVGLKVGMLVLLIVYLSLGLTRTASAALRLAMR